MEESRSLDDAISEHNGSRTIFQQFKDLRVSVTKVWNAINGIDTRVILSEADIMDLRHENKVLRSEMGKIMRWNKEASQDLRNENKVLRSEIEIIKKGNKDDRNAR